MSWDVSISTKTCSVLIMGLRTGHLATQRQTLLFCWECPSFIGVFIEFVLLVEQTVGVLTSRAKFRGWPISGKWIIVARHLARLPALLIRLQYAFHQHCYWFEYSICFHQYWATGSTAHILSTSTATSFTTYSLCFRPGAHYVTIVYYRALLFGTDRQLFW